MVLNKQNPLTAFWLSADLFLYRKVCHHLLLILFEKRDVLVCRECHILVAEHGRDKLDVAVCRGERFGSVSMAQGMQPAVLDPGETKQILETLCKCTCADRHGAPFVMNNVAGVAFRLLGTQGANDVHRHFIDGDSVAARSCLRRLNAQIIAMLRFAVRITIPYLHSITYGHEPLSGIGYSYYRKDLKKIESKKILDALCAQAKGVDICEQFFRALSEVIPNLKQTDFRIRPSKARDRGKNDTKTQDFDAEENALF